MLEAVISSLTFSVLAAVLCGALYFGKARKWRQSAVCGGALIALLLIIPTAISAANGG